jgi:hypothetical protein
MDLVEVNSGFIAFYFKFCLQLITVYKSPGLDPDWLMAERGPQKGKVPTTYLEVLE